MGNLGHFMYGFIVMICILKLWQLTANWWINGKKFDALDHILHLGFTIMFYTLMSITEAIRQGPLPPQ